MLRHLPADNRILEWLIGTGDRDQHGIARLLDVIHHLCILIPLLFRQD